ncbi:MAG: CDP-alcohol phosphatidyltransferase family protein [Acidimicrobiia bacterium]
MTVEPVASPRRRSSDPSAVRTRANLITAARVVIAVPLLWAMYGWGPSWWTWGGWTLLALTDVLDGWLARRDGVTHSGAFLDPLADKLLTLGGFAVLVARDDLWWVPVAIIAAREIGVSVFRSVALRRGLVLRARRLGKAKTFVQLLAVGLFLWPVTATWTTFNRTVVWLAVALTIVSGLDIVLSARRPSKLVVK